MMRWVIVLLAVAALAGCGVGPGEAKTGGVELRVTRDFGQRPLGDVARRSKVRESDTVMRFLQSQRKVTTRYGGGFVQSIDGLAGDQAAERDWFYYVNGSEASVGAADYKLHPGDVVQWDFHDWHATQHIPAIVGAYPEPFLHGLKGKRVPTRLECEEPDGAACKQVSDTLGRLGVNVTGSAIGAPASEGTLRVIVAKFSVASQVRGAESLTKGPATSGVYARFNKAGTVLELLDARGQLAQFPERGTGLIAATQPPAQAVTWLITGVDDAAVERAAGALSEPKLRGTFALAVPPRGRPLALPTEAAP